ncbi:hypothetical protein CB1_001108060 [Camelus ferus]|nr:hypothetical protein CB1_001108060 [Camelus ferus]
MAASLLCSVAPAEEALDPHIHGDFFSPSGANPREVSALLSPSGTLKNAVDIHRYLLTLGVTTTGLILSSFRIRALLPLACPPAQLYQTDSLLLCRGTFMNLALSLCIVPAVFEVDLQKVSV